MNTQAQGATVLQFPSPKTFKQRYADCGRRMQAGGDYGDYIDEIIQITVDKMVSEGRLTKRSTS